jgi:hypothetical protein
LVCNRIPVPFLSENEDGDKGCACGWGLRA